MAALNGLASALESYRGRDRLVRLGPSGAGGHEFRRSSEMGQLRPERGQGRSGSFTAKALPKPRPLMVDIQIRTLGYCCQLVGGVLVEQCPARFEVGTRLLVVSAQLSHCRTVLRLFDDLAMFVYTKQYGLGSEEKDVFVRWLSVLGNIADQLYYPCEHVAWAADAKVLRMDSARWWTLSTALWGFSLLLGVARSLWMVLRLRQRLRNPMANLTSIYQAAQASGQPETASP
ncbi:peroxisomal membrane protein 11C isoform 4-T4 [Callospermophilus lateralis]|uniref:peroxisomal membrane protein 11C isoform X4 n=1 Tax=Callospermophilus lateralis TaxID=76772 RepID=UPI004053C854